MYLVIWSVTLLKIISNPCVMPRCKDDCVKHQKVRVCQKIIPTFLRTLFEQNIYRFKGEFLEFLSIIFKVMQYDVVNTYIGSLYG